eukprot:TRINITY_DN66623_c0_g1_i1.p3 TRINITY_DN66623_c0_g1~~TRINITY_DN66623_c0_g1_i1.p3  ORF type:complete len:109 (-),score=7.91 TRINITY_DN66623_c0_g1_i1:56-382(-)
MSTTRASISTKITSSTVLYFKASRAAPPGPPPQMSTRRAGLRSSDSGTCTKYSWYTCSSTSVDCNTPSRDKQMPKVSLLKIKACWSSVCSSYKTVSTVTGPSGTFKYN